MPARPIRETTTLSPKQSPSKPGGTRLREVTRLEEPRRKPSKPAPKTAKPDSQ